MSGLFLHGSGRLLDGGNEVIGEVVGMDVEVSDPEELAFDFSEPIAYLSGSFRILGLDPLWSVGIIGALDPGSFGRG